MICPTAKAEYFSREGWTGFFDLPVGLVFKPNPVIASEAKQSMAPHTRRDGLLRRYRSSQ
jgi:hypothetical protein